ncbi:ABC transporter substrate-binding protein [Reinekea sp. G2M2-21]|uniref:substrate-binding periplasmic protein n=1 Tax=Reinekea sp. G2M2-21 TaxID=2788942 RepID=UPI0018AB5F86|nr:transporter substrate-binding domain-containing protein [Reinekea sp. G2M2-21]
MNAYRRIMSLALFLISGLVMTCHADTLAIVGDDKAKPKNWLDSTGQPRGIMIDLLNDVSNRTGIEFTYDLSPWNRAFTLSSNGKGAIIGFSKTAERQQLWDFSEPMYTDELVIVTTKAKTFDFTGLASLTGKRLAIKKGSSYGDDFEIARKNGDIAIVESTDRAGQMRMLELNRVDAVLISPGRVALETVIAENEWLSEHRDDFIILPRAYKKDLNYLGIPKSMGKSYLLRDINKALLDMRKDGTYQAIVDKNIQAVLDQLTNSR